MRQRAGQDTILLSLLLVVLGFSGNDFVRRQVGLIAEAGNALDAAYGGSVLGLAAAMVLTALRLRVASLVCIIAALALAARDLHVSVLLTSSALSLDTLLISMCPMLVIGMLAQRSRLGNGLRLRLAMTPAFCCIAISVPLCLGIALGGVGWAALDTLVLGAAYLVISVFWIDYVLRVSSIPVWIALKKVVWPFVLAGLIGIGTVTTLVTTTWTPLPGGEGFAWAVAGGLLIAWFVFAAVAVVKAGSEAFMLKTSAAKQRRILRRQRQIMHRRAKELRRSRAHYEELFMNVPIPVVLTSTDGVVLAANPALLSLLGCESEDQLKRINFAEFYADPTDRAKLVEFLQHSDSDTHQGELEMRRLDGEHRSVLYAIRCVRGVGGSVEYLQGSITDISDLRRAESDQRRLEANLRLSQKLESVGRLAAGIAHEINTPMQYIGDNVFFLEQSFGVLNAQLQRADGSDDEEIESLIAEVPGAIARAREGIETVNHIVGAMKELAHPGKGAKTSADVNAIIDTALTVTRNTYKTVAEVKTLLGALPSMLAYKNELCQVIINLIVNAAQAIESRGVFGAIEIQTSYADEFISIRISDSGCGIPKAALDEIFDPFFTTKGVGKGTGQGLSIARTIIADKHGGEIDVESEVGVGTTFRIKLPVGTSDSEESTT